MDVMKYEALVFYVGPNGETCTYRQTFPSLWRALDWASAAMRQQVYLQVNHEYLFVKPTLIKVREIGSDVLEEA